MDLERLRRVHLIPQRQAQRTVAGGEALLAPAVLRRLVDRHAQTARPMSRERLAVLTDREVFRKLDLRDRVQAVVLAYETGPVEAAD